MRIAILGGTGDLGAGLALRWGRDTDHDLLVGSREPERARDAADSYEAILADHGVERSVLGFENGMAAERGAVVVLAVAPEHLEGLLDSIGPRLDGSAIVVSPAVGMEPGADGMTYTPPPQGSVAALVRERTPEPIPVVGAFHTLPAGPLADLDRALDLDTLVFGDDSEAVAQIRTLATEIEGVGSLSAGGLGNAAAVESLTPLLVTLGQENATADPGLKIQ